MLIVSIIASSGVIMTVEASVISAAGGWQAAELLDIASDSTYTPQIAMNDDGDAIVVWNQVDGSNFNLYAAKYWASNDTWSDPVLLETESGAVDVPQIAMDDDGNAIAVWPQFDGSVYYNLYAAKYWSSNDTWETAKLLESTSGDAFSSQIAMDDDGNAIVVWSQTDLSNFNLYAAKYWSSNDTWETAKLLESTSGDVETPQIATDGDGNAIAVWCQGYNIYAAKYWSSNDTWETATLLETAIYNAYSQQIAMNDDGDAIAVWRQYDGSADNIYAAKYWSSNDTWSVRVLLETASDSAYTPQIATDDDGNAVAVWQQKNESVYSIYAAMYWASNNTWSDPVLLETASDSASDPQIVTDDDGNAIAVWCQGYNIYAANYWSSNDIWVTATLLESLSGHASYPQIAMDDDGDAIAVWLQDESPDSVYAAVYSDPTKVMITSPSDGSTVTTPSVRINGTANPSATVVVNGILVYVNDDGNFSVVIALEEGENIIIVTAINETLGLTTSASIIVTYENEMQDVIDDLKTRLTVAEAAINATNILLSNVNDTLSECYDAQNATADEVADMIEDITSMKEALIELRASLNDTNGNLISTDANVTAMAGDLDEMISNLSTIESTLQGEIDDTNARISEIYDALNDTEDWLASVNDTLSECYDAQNATADEVADMLEDITIMKATLIELRASLNDTNGSLISTDANVTV
ncbi:MAG: hypothetical protein LUQ09_02680, partial [Methanomassiliicoccales archaeon]|nr:hypothetical protein [Methanomassiliicoccales archaeon]